MKNRFSHLPSTLLHLTLPFTLCLLTSSISFSQSDVLKYARTIIDTLAAPGMHGRGYVNKGDSIAAHYIENVFKSLKLKSFNKETYSQTFFITINTIENPSFYWQGVALKPGVDYLVGSSSPIHLNGHGSYAIWLDSTVVSSEKNTKHFLKKVGRNTYVVVDDKGVDLKKSGELFKKIKQNDIKTKGAIIIEHKKLTHEISTFQNDYPIIKLLIPDSIDIITSHKNQKVTMFITNFLEKNYKTQNIIGHIKGTQYPDSFIVFSAHYDHLGQMGKDVYFPGANDNASGCAMLLNLAKYYSEHPPKYSVAFMAFGAEEVGLLGSKFYTEHPLFPLKQIKFLVNMDIMGTGDEGIKVVNATEHKKEFAELLRINEEKKLLPSIQPRGKAKNSDHYFFEEAGVKTFFIYTLGGIKAYHDIYDRPETLPLTEFEDVFKLLTEFSDSLQK